MKDKYYTPEIEEFCVGLEFEYKYPFSAYADKEKIDFQPFAWDSPTQQVVFCKNGIMIGGYHISEFRVKYLDRSDIESLGYEIIQDEHNCQWFKNANGNIEIGLENDYHLTIRFTQSFGLFSGTLKNKSELKRLLKQLGI